MPEGGSSNLLLIAILVIGALGMFLLTRRNRKQQGSVSDFRTSLAPGQEVMTASGQLGTVVAKDGDAVTIESGGHRSVWVIAAIQPVPPQFTAAADSAFGRAPEVANDDDDDVAEPVTEPEYGALTDGPGDPRSDGGTPGTTPPTGDRA